MSDFDKEELKAAVQAVVHPDLEVIPPDLEETDRFDDEDHVYVNDSMGGTGRWIATHEIEGEDVMYRHIFNKRTGEKTRLGYYCRIDGSKVIPNKYKPAKQKGLYRVEETRRTQYDLPLFTLCAQAEVSGEQVEDIWGNTAQPERKGHVLLYLQDKRERYVVQLPAKIDVIATRIED